MQLYCYRDRSPLGALIEDRRSRLDEYYGNHDHSLPEDVLSMEGASPPPDATKSVEPDPLLGLTAAASEYARQTSMLNPEGSLDHTPSSSFQLDTEAGHKEGPAESSSSSPAHQGTSSPTHLIASSPAHVARVETDSGGGGGKRSRSFLHSRHSHKAGGGSGDSTHLSGRMKKRPSAFSVVFGSQYNTAISQGTLHTPVASPWPLGRFTVIPGPVMATASHFAHGGTAIVTWYP